MQPNDITTLIRSRESVFPKDFIPGKEIDQQILEEILTNASWAPSHRMTEPWFFKIYSGKGKDTLLQHSMLVYEALNGSEKTPFFKQKFEKKLNQSSHILLVCMKRDPKKSVPEWEEIAAVACAVQNLHLSLSGRSIGGYWSSPGFCNADLMLRQFNLSNEDKCLGFFFLGHVSEEYASRKNRNRKDLNAFTEWVND
jgi:nitroreductase